MIPARVPMTEARYGFCPIEVRKYAAPEPLEYGHRPGPTFGSSRTAFTSLRVARISDVTHPRANASVPRFRSATVARKVARSDVKRIDPSGP
jgi:hypothetical protein